ncbi:MAG: peptide chain release factor N(5)-glutamine methyltransferase [Bacteroidota bacterium]|nr:peptide chain release factor N(5)-glutamine methyltransferase [Bacteroidota bacterium]
MTNVIKHIKSELSALYNQNEVESFVSLLLYKIGKIDRVQRLISDNIAFTHEQMILLNDAISRLKKYEPIQYILGKTEFYGLTIKTDRRALIPRPETEELVDWILHEYPKAQTVLDICTGSGCIAIGLAKQLSTAKVDAIDISCNAIDLAKENANINKAPIDFYQADILSTDSLSQKYDIIVSNPPYITISEKTDMMPNVLDYEPDLALFVDNENPIVFYKKIADLATTYLKEGGMLFFEINRKFGNEIVSLLACKGFRDIVLKKDISGNDRFIKCSI